MKQYEVLSQCESKLISPKKAYKQLFVDNKPRRLKRAHFIKLRIVIREHPGISIFLALLFALPIPVGIAKMFLRKRMDHVIDESFPITYRALFDDLLVKGIEVRVHAKKEANILIKTI